MKTLITSIGQSQQAKRGIAALTALILFFMPYLRDSQAAFELNFDPSKTSGHSYTSMGFFTNCENYSINMSFMANSDCGGRTIAGAHDDGTGAFQRVFTYGGKTYYHVIIGDYTNPNTTDTFFMEYYIEAGGGAYQNGGGATSASAYTNTADMNCNNSNTDCLYNMVNPYGANTDLGGTGSGNPNKVVMRMILNDGITYSEFLKGAGDTNGDGNYDDSSAFFDKKPFIKQIIDDPTGEKIYAEYSLDMRSKTYSDSTPVSEAETTNKTFIFDGNNAANQGDYDSTFAVVTPAMFRRDQPTINGGAYTYTDGTSFGNSYGSYTYYNSDGTTLNPTQTQPVNRDYSVFCMPDQNTDWSGNGACVNGNGTSGRRTGGGWGGW